MTLFRKLSTSDAEATSSVGALTPNSIDGEVGLLKSPAVGDGACGESHCTGAGSFWGGRFVDDRLAGSTISAVSFFLNVRLRIVFLVLWSSFGGALKLAGTTSFGRMGASAPCPRRCLVEIPWLAGMSEGAIKPRFAWSLLVPRLGIFISFGNNLFGIFLLDSAVSGDDGSENKDVGDFSVGDFSFGDEKIS